MSSSSARAHGLAVARRAAVLVALLVSACGFQLRGDSPMAVKTLFVSSVGASQVAVDVRRRLASAPTRVVKAPADAEAHLRILSETREKTIYTITGSGRVYEFQLRLLVSYEVTMTGKDEPVIAPAQIELRRLVTYSESAPLAKEAEEQLLYRDMISEASMQILRRLAVLKRPSAT